MDKNILEYWGNYFLNAAKTQQNIEEFNNMMQQWVSGYGKMMEMFGNSGSASIQEKEKSDLPDYNEQIKKTSAEFQKSFREYLTIFDMVPKTDYLALAKSNEDLKDKLKDREETIGHLRKLLNEKGDDQGRVADGLRELIEKQSSEFQDLLKSMSSFFPKGKEKS